ncbi:MAG TPA: hypothetical protein PLL78_02890 [Fimbriimonadaceae bacterium]|mgnify:CR=1 FL=1|nr:hypothetical protein [Fimbriimonadaceae bacterium]HRJ95607.1 hypothetical protein [Fimbriimonadaceae bacterium]
MDAKKIGMATLGVAVGTCAGAQVPDLVSALDAGGRAMGMGGGIYTAGADTMSSYNNPAGLGYLSDTTIGLNIRNLPESDTVLTRDFRTPQTETTYGSGPRAITHAGIAYPFKGRGGRTNGTLGLAYTTGGYMRDFRSGTDLRDGDLTIRNMAELNKVKSDFFTISYGTAGNSFAWGVGVIFTATQVETRQFYQIFDQDNQDRGFVDTDNRDTANGVGGIVGLQFIPPGGNISVGLSYRTPIDLNGNDSTEGYYDRIPGRLSGGLAIRSGGLRGGRDFLIFGVQADGYIGGKKDAVLSRKDQWVFGGGVEYNLNFANALIPFRFGFNAVGKGGDGFFEERNTFTFGIGYRPFGSTVGLDLNFATTGEGGGMDMALGLTYRFASK